MAYEGTVVAGRYEIEHLAGRGLWREVELDGRTVRVPGPLFAREVA